MAAVSAATAVSQAAAAPVADDSSDDEDYKQFKVVIIGDGSVGKTSIAHRFASDSFEWTYRQTVGADFYLKQLSLPNSTEVAMQIWDIGGQSLGSAMMKAYLTGADCLVLVYDITSNESFSNLEDWLEVAKKSLEEQEAKMPLCVLIGNKTDLSHVRTVKMAKHEQFAKDNGMGQFLVSAKTGDQVQTAFFRIAADLAGVPLTRPDVQVNSKVVRAEIVNHVKDDPAVKTAEPPKDGKGGVCVIS